MIEHIRHDAPRGEIMRKINEIIRVTNEVNKVVHNLTITPAQKKKLARVNKLREQLRQLEMELG